MVAFIGHTVELKTIVGSNGLMLEAFFSFSGGLFQEVPGSNPALTRCVKFWGKPEHLRIKNRFASVHSV